VQLWDKINIFLFFLSKNTGSKIINWRRLMKKSLFVCFVFMFTGVLGIYAGGRIQEGTKRPSVVFSVSGTNAPYIAATVAAFKEFAGEKNWDYVVLDGQLDNATNVKNFEQATAMKPDVIAAVLHDANMLSNAIKAAYEAGIPVVCDNTMCLETDKQYVNCFNGVDDIIAGRVSAELMSEALGGKGRIVIIEGTPGGQTTVLRSKGFYDRLKEMNSPIEVLSVNTSDWKKEQATRVMADFLTRYEGKIDGIWSHDDESAAGAALAIKEAGIPKGKIKIVGTGGSKTGFQMVKEGEFYGTCFQSPRASMRLTVDAIDDIIRNKIKAGQNFDPFYRYIPLPKVTADTVDKYTPEW
jgi:ribose transport system substrate-binding protein